MIFYLPRRCKFPGEAKECQLFVNNRLFGIGYF